MSNSSTSKRPIGPVRQHSLPQPPRHQRQIRRQKSTENERNLKSYSTSSTSFRDRFTDNSNTCHSPTLVRPKVRVAWSEQSVKSKKDDGVEIIAHQIKTSKFNRSAAGRDNKAITGRYSLAEKSPILYSRQDLEERLKLAWRQREENKSNIDIFLAHNTVGERCDSGMSADTNPTAQSTPKSHKKVRNSGKLQPNDDQTTNEAEDTRKDKSEKKITEGHDCDTRFPARRSMERPVYESQHVNDNSVSIRASEGNVKRSFISINCRNWNTEMSIKSKEDVISDEEGKGPSTILSKEADYSQARVRRANYQNGTSKAFAGPILEKSSLQKCTSRDKQSPDERGRLRRTSSAPPQRRAQANVVQSTSGMPVSSSGPEEDRWPMKVKEEKRPRVKSCMIGSRPIKSASAVKRRSKANKRRGISVTCTKDGDGETGPESARGKGRSVNVGNTFLGKSADVVTMVSLVSSADSDSEMDEISLKDDELICKLRNKLPRTPIIKSSNCLSSRNRKPFKSEAINKKEKKVKKVKKKKRRAWMGVSLSRTQMNLSSLLFLISALYELFYQLANIQLTRFIRRQKRGIPRTL